MDEVWQLLVAHVQSKDKMYKDMKITGEADGKHKDDLKQMLAELEPVLRIDNKVHGATLLSLQLSMLATIDRFTTQLSELSLVTALAGPSL